MPVAGENVTNDIAIGMRTSIDTAEKIKIEYGSCLPEDIHDRETIDLSLLSKNRHTDHFQKQLAEIIQARYHEIFMMVKDELAKIQRDGMLPAGAILTGAAVKMPEFWTLPVKYCTCLYRLDSRRTTKEWWIKLKIHPMQP